jgi:MoxR-like ATPase
VDPVIDTTELLALQAAVERIHVEDDLIRYAVHLARGTRTAQNVAVGPRRADPRR